MVSAHILANYLSQSLHISDADNAWLEYDLCRIWIYQVKGQGHKSSFCKQWFPRKTIFHRAIIFHMLIGFGKNTT